MYLFLYFLKVRSHQMRMKRYAQMIYMLSQCKDAIDNPAALFQGSRFFIICHIHNHTSIISSEMQVELKKNTAFTWGKWGEKKIIPRLCSLGSTVWEQEKHFSNTKAHTPWHSHRGSESGPASSHLIPQPLIWRWSDPLDQASGSKRTEGGGNWFMNSIARLRRRK